MTISEYELKILDFIAAHSGPGWLDMLMITASSLMKVGILWIILGMIFLLAGRTPARKRLGAGILAALLFSLILCNGVLKMSVGRVRPFVLNPSAELLVAPQLDPSFPSGHASASFAAAFVMLRSGAKGRWLSLAFAVLVGISRLYLYQHYPTDVIAGAAVGLLSGALSLRVMPALLAAAQKHGWPLLGNLREETE